MSHFISTGLLCGLVLAAALQAAIIKGRVVDRSGDPIADANIKLSGSTLGTSSKADGHFRLELPLESPGRIHVSHLGYVSRELLLPVGGESYTIRMLPSLLEGKPVTVLSGRSNGERPVTFTNLGGEDIERMHQGQDLTRLLDGTPNLVCLSYSGTSIGYNEIRLRGFDQKRVEVLVNGIPLNDPEDHYVYWVDLPDMGSSLKDIQVQRGTGGASLGGSNFGGSVNMLTDLKDTPGGSHQLAVGSFGTQKASFALSSGLIDGRWQLDGRLSRIRTEGFRDRTGVEMWGYYLAGRGLFDWGSVRINRYDGRQVSHVAWDGVDETVLFGLNGQLKDRSANSYARYDNSIDDFMQPHTELMLASRLPDGSDLDVSLYHVGGKGFYETLKQGVEPVDYGLDMEGTPDLVNRRWILKDQAGFSADNRRELGRGSLHLGLNGYLYAAEHFGEVIRLEADDAATLPGGRYYVHDTAKQKLGGHARLSWPLATGLVVEAGLAVQSSSYELMQRPSGSFQGSLLNRFTDDHVFLNPTIGLSWSPLRQLSFHGSASVSNREPSRSEYWNAWEGPDDLGKRPMFARADTLADGSLEWSAALIDPERMLDLELGMAWRGESFMLGLNCYWLDMRDEIVNYGGVDEESPIKGNAPRSHHAGIELDGRWRLDQWLELGGNLALSENQIDELIVHETAYGPDWSVSTVARDFAGNPIALSPDIVGNFWIDLQPFDWLHIRPKLQHIGEQYLDNSNDDGFSALHPDLIDPAWLDTTGGLRFHRRLDAYTLLGLESRLSLRHWLGQDLSLRLGVENLLDTEYETGGYWNDWVDSNGDYSYEPQRVLYPGAGRNWLLSLDWNF